MKKVYIFIIGFAAVMFIGAPSFAQQMVQASIQKTLPLVITVYAKPVQTINAGSNLNITYALSLPLSGAPVSGVTSASLVGGAPNPAGFEDIGGRRCYPFNLEVSSSSISLPAGVSTAIATVTFPPTEAGKKVQMNDCGDHSSFTCSNFIYWYIAVSGTEVTNLSNMFYGTSFTNAYPNASFVAETHPLPIQLLSFNAEKNGEKNTILNWSTASESNSNYFGIERSYDKISWKTVGQVKAAGNSQIVLNYNFLDKDAYDSKSSSVVVYYRLKMIDLDDSFKYSPIQSVNFGKPTDAVVNSNNFLVYPNPASEGIHVEWDANQVDQPTALEFYDVAGKLIYTEKVEDQTNQHYVDFTQTNIQTGLSLMRVMSGDKAIEYKQIVVGQNH